MTQKAADKNRFKPDESIQSALYQRHQRAIKDFSDKLLEIRITQISQSHSAQS